MMTTPIIFIHIPKAAGQTLRSIVARQYSREEILNVEEQRGQPLQSLKDAANTRVIIGHVPFGIHQRIGVTCTYATMLREPIDRVISLYRYIATTPEHHLHDKVRGMALTDFASSDIDVEEVENGQTRQIAGETHGSPDASSVDLAKENLSNAFSAVGLMERFDESVVLFKRRFGWKVPWYVMQNVTPGGPSPVPTTAYEIIKSRNSLDIELYEFARALFQEQLRQEGPLLRVQVIALRSANAVASRLKGVRDVWVRGMWHGSERL